MGDREEYGGILSTSHHFVSSLSNWALLITHPPRPPAPEGLSEREKKIKKVVDMMYKKNIFYTYHTTTTATTTAKDVLYAHACTHTPTPTHHPTYLNLKNYISKSGARSKISFSLGSAYLMLMAGFLCPNNSISCEIVSFSTFNIL